MDTIIISLCIQLMRPWEILQLLVVIWNPPNICTTCTESKFKTVHLPPTYHFNIIIIGERSVHIMHMLIHIDNGACMNMEPSTS